MNCRAFCQLALLLLGGCARLARPVVETLPNGIVYVRNTGPTAWRDTTGWKWIPTATFDIEKESPRGRATIGAISWGDDDRLYVLGPSTNAIRVYGADGTYLRGLGRDRDTVTRAPGAPVELSIDGFEDNGDPIDWGEEFRFYPESNLWQAGLLAIRGDTIALQYRVHSSIRFVDPGASSSKEKEYIPGLAWMPLTVDSSGRLWLPATPDSARSVWIRIRMNGTIIDTIRAPLEQGRERKSDWCGSRWQGDGFVVLCADLPNQPTTSAIPRHDGLIVVGNTAALRFAVLRPAGDTVRVFESHAPTIALSDAQRDSLIILRTVDADTAIELQKRVGAKRTDFPGTTLPWSGMALDGEGRLWVGLPEWTGAITRLQVFDRRGVLLGDVPPPSAEMFGMAAWSRDRLAVVEKDRNGRQVIKTFRLQMSPPQ